MLLKPDDILGNRLRLERLIGEGGMGSVWCAYDMRANQRVALKFLRGSGSEASLKRFFREARTSTAVAHPNVVRVHEVLVAPDGMPLMVMDYLEGESLGGRLERERKLSLEETVRIVAQVLAAIGSAHARGVIHRDLKPDNIFLCKGGVADDVRVLDFGVAKLTAEKGEAMATAALTATGAVIGTPYYMSPEQVFADKTIDHRADIWSLGIILYECLSGKKPLGGDSIGALLRAITNGDMPKLRSVEPGLPEPIYALVDRMISVDREQRPRDLREVFEVVGAFLPVRASVPFGEATSDGSISFDDTIPSEMMSLQQTNDGVTRSSTPQALPPKRQMALIALVAALGGGAVIGVVAWKGSTTHVSGDPAMNANAPPPPSTVLTPNVSAAMPTLAPIARGSATPSPSASSASSGASGARPIAPRVRPLPSAAPSSGTALTAAPPPTASTPKPSGPVIDPNNPY